MPEQVNGINDLEPAERKKYRDEIKRLTTRIIKTEKTKQTNTKGYGTLKEELQKSEKQDDLGEVFKGLVKGVIIAYNVFGSRTVRVDVERTKESLDMLKQNSNLASIWHQGGVPNDNLSNS